MTRTHLFSAMTGASLFHFAGHAVFDPRRPEASYLVLGGESGEEPERLYVLELEASTRPAPRLVVLAACSSISPSPQHGGGFWGLAQPLIANGSQAVVGTLWDVGDIGAREVSTGFHRGWAQGLPARRALREIQVRLIESGDRALASPRVWAAFQQIGLAP